MRTMLSCAAASLGWSWSATGWICAAASTTSHCDWTQPESREVTSKTKRLGNVSPTSSPEEACQSAHAALLAIWIWPFVSNTSTAGPELPKVLKEKLGVEACTGA